MNGQQSLDTRPASALAAAEPRTVVPPRFVGWTRETTLSLGGGAVIILATLGFFGLASFTDADTWVPIGVLFSLCVVSYPIISRVAGAPRDTKLFKLLLLAFALKMLFTGPRYMLNENYYEGEGDAARYDQAGDFFVQNLANNKWSIEGSELQDFPKETRVVGYVVGVLFLIFGTTYFGGYLIFSWLSWVGLIFFFKAFRLAYPNAPPYRAAALIFFLPSMMFWPSSLGKEALMVCLIGVAVFGITRMLMGAKVIWGAVMAAGSLALVAQIRPHLVVVILAALIVSSLVRSTRTSGLRGIAFRVFLVAAAFPLLLIGLQRVDNNFGGSSSLTSNLNSTVERTNIGGSAFEATPVRSPTDVPGSIVTVVFRPFIFEATTVPVLLASIEGLLISALTIASVRWLWRIGPAMAASPFAAFCGGYVLVFVIAFSNIGNAGILARQRVQMFPVLMLLVAAAYENHRLHVLSLTTNETEPERTAASLRLSPRT